MPRLIVRLVFDGILKVDTYYGLWMNHSFQKLLSASLMTILLAPQSYAILNISLVEVTMVAVLIRTVEYEYFGCWRLLKKYQQIEHTYYTTCMPPHLYSEKGFVLMTIFIFQNCFFLVFLKIELLRV